MTTTYILSQLCGIMAFGFALAGFLNGNDKTLKLLIGASAVSMAAHLALLEAWAGMAISLVAAARYIVSSYTKNIGLMALFMAVGVAYGAFIHQTWSDALPILANILATFAIFNLTGPSLRVCLVLTSCFWITYNGIHGSVVGVGSEGFYMLANLFHIWQHTRKPVTYNI